MAEADPFAVLPPCPDALSEMYAADWRNCTDPTEKNARASYGHSFAVPGVRENCWNTM